MYLVLNEIFFKSYKSFLIVIFFLIVFLINLNAIYVKNLSNNNNNKNNNSKNIQKNINNSFTGNGDNSDPEKLKKIFKIILYIILFLLGGIFLYYIYSLYLPVNFTIEDALEQLKILLPEEKYNQIYVVVLEMMDRPDKVGSGLHLLHLIKTLLKEDFPQKFEKIMNDIISYFEGKK